MGDRAREWRVWIVIESRCAFAGRAAPRSQRYIIYHLHLTISTCIVFFSIFLCIDGQTGSGKSYSMVS